MAKLDLSGLKGLDDFMEGISELASDIDELAKDCVNAATPTLANVLKNNISAAANRNEKDRKTGARTGKPYSTGELAQSIVPTEAKTNAYGNFAAVRPVGSDKNGVRNGEKLAYLEYGTSKQEAHPVMAKSIAQAEPQTKEIIQERFNEHVKQIVGQ